MNDLNIIKQIEEELGATLKETEEFITYAKCYHLNQQGKVTGLSLSNCKIDDLNRVGSKLKALTNLTGLDLSSNQLTGIEVIKDLNNLTWLSLNQNSIKELLPWITKFDMEFKWSGNSRENGNIHLYGNPLKRPPVEIVKQGKSAVRDYFKSLRGVKTQLNEAKVLLVGEGMAGKTSLLKSLQGFEFDKDESQTHGVNVQTVSGQEIPGFEDVMDEEDCKLHFWDFGGQEIMHASHQFFLSKRSLYILILDSRTDGKKQYWLKHIEKHGGDSPVIVALNKIDDNPGYNVEQNKINSEFPKINNRFFRISCKTKDGIPELVKTVANAISETSLFGTEISVNWMKVKDTLAEETDANRYISRDRFEEICEDNNVNEKSGQQTLLQFLNDLGVVLYFRQLNLGNIYVLDPHWVTIGVYKIINSQKLRGAY